MTHVTLCSSPAAGVGAWDEQSMATEPRGRKLCEHFIKLFAAPLKSNGGLKSSCSEFEH